MKDPSPEFIASIGPFMETMRRVAHPAAIWTRIRFDPTGHGDMTLMVKGPFGTVEFGHGLVEESDEAAREHAIRRAFEMQAQFTGAIP